MSTTTCVAPVSSIPARLADQGIGATTVAHIPGGLPPSRSVSLANPLAVMGPSLRVTGIFVHAHPGQPLPTGHLATVGLPNGDGSDRGRSDWFKLDQPP
jgi:hypothetical protein